MSNPTSAVRCLMKRHHLTESEIVSKLAEMGIKTSQPTINRIKRGNADACRYEVGAGLIRLHEALHQS